MKKHTQKIKLLKVKLGHLSSIEHDRVGKAIGNKSLDSEGLLPAVLQISC